MTDSDTDSSFDEAIPALDHKTFHGIPGLSITRKTSHTWSIPIPFLGKRSDPDDNGNSLYHGAGERSSQATTSVAEYVIGLILLFLPAIVYLASLGKYSPPVLWFGTFVGSIKLFKAFRNSRRLKTFGATRLKFESSPRVGEPLVGCIGFDKRLPNNQALELKLTCFEEVERRTSSRTRTYYVEYWSSVQYTRLHSGAGTSEFSFCFDVPADLPSDQIFAFHWSLDLVGVVRKKRFARSWDVPMETASEANDASST